MSRQGMIVAKQYAEQLPIFSNKGEAEQNLLTQRDATLFEFISEHSAALGLNFSIESLKELEAWYFQMRRPDSGGTGYSLPHAIGFYFGEILCRNYGFKWTVEEFVFKKMQYEIGVTKNRLTIMLTKGKCPKIDGNKRMQSLWRECKSYAI
ncbi:MAG TPA: hypothetical protein VIF82_01410 [Burkholderiaceae bacterium]